MDKKFTLIVGSEDFNRLTKLCEMNTKNIELTKEQQQEFNRGLFNMHIVEGEHPSSDVAEYFYLLGLNSKYKNNNG